MATLLNLSDAARVRRTILPSAPLSAIEARQLINGTGLKQKEIADELGVTATTINRWLTGAAPIPTWGAICLRLLAILAAPKPIEGASGVEVCATPAGGLDRSVPVGQRDQGPGEAMD
jgi:DNA-binding transcriptional regulator YiaG